MKTLLTRCCTACLAATALLSGCAVGPDYVRPALAVSPHYKEDGRWKTAQPLDEVPRGAWWQVFRDEQLDRYMSRLDRQSPTIAQAEAQYRQAQALLDQARAGLWPGVSATAGYVRGTNTSTGTVGKSYQLGLSASWEMDVWGAVRRSVEAGEAHRDAGAAQLQAIRLSSQAQLATAYLQWVVAGQQLRQLALSEELLAQALTLTRNQYQAGVVSQVEVSLAEAQWKSAQSARTDKQLTRAQLEHAVAAALGELPASFEAPAEPALPHLPNMPAGLPSALLERRPDIAVAERNMAEANARIGVAKAAYFPSLTLAASGGYDSPSFAHWLSLPNRVWSLGPQLALSVFDGGLRRAQTAQAIANYDATVAGYRQTVLSAFQAVEDNLAAQALLAEEYGHQEQALAAARQAEAIALNQYRAGTVSYLSVITAQNTRIAAENTLWDIKNRQYVSSIALIVALGGGWGAPPAA